MHALTSKSGFAFNERILMLFGVKNEVGKQCASPGMLEARNIFTRLLYNVLSNCSYLSVRLPTKYHRSI